jgi:DNA-binding SARP family transcriptional activator
MSTAIASPALARDPIVARLLGEFEVHIAGRRIEWIRSKDGKLVKFLLLEPSGRASRADLCRIFWPLHDRQQAAQNLRTSCSNIRTALRRALPESRVEFYFRCDRNEVMLATELAQTDLSRFMQHVTEAREAMAARRLDVAIEIYEAARALYHGPLILDAPTETHDEIAANVNEAWNEIQRHLLALQRIGARLPRLYRVA